MDLARVVEVYAPEPGGGWQIGSGYRISDDLVLTAAHVVVGLPTHPRHAAVPDDPNAAGVGQVRPLREPGVTAGVLVWRDAVADVAVLRLARARRRCRRAARRRVGDRSQAASRSR